MLSQNLYGLPSRTDFPGGTSTSSGFLGQTVRDEAQFFPTTRTDELLRDRTLAYTTKSALDTASDLSGTSWQYGYEVTQGGEVVFDVFSGEVSLGLRGSPLFLWGATSTTSCGGMSRIGSRAMA